MTTTLFDAAALSNLQSEFRRSMKRLLLDLCRELAADYAQLSRRFGLPADYFHFVAQALDDREFCNWKVVGWIEALNDLVYFLDLLQQVGKERDPRDFAEQLFAECEQKFFENSYLDELFPQGRRQPRRLALRLQWLCARLAREVTQESLFFDPRWAIQWSRQRRLDLWDVAGTLDQHVERAEPAWTLPSGTEGDTLVVPPSVVRAVRQAARPVTFEIDRDGIVLRKGRRFPICTLHGNRVEWHWTRKGAVTTADVQQRPPTVGPTLRYDKEQRPEAVGPTRSGHVKRIGRAWEAIRLAWPEGHEVLALLTSRVIPLSAKGVVSFSYRHRPGLSFINCFDRDNLDLIDDLIHENSHHHLNLLLRKHVMYRGDRNQQIFYSPWRRSLRPIRGILHATFTFTMGALLFERLSTWAETATGISEWKAAGLTRGDLLRARFRCFEEIESVRYSFQDLDYAGRHLKWITGSGARLVRQLEEVLSKAEQRIARHRNEVLASKFGPALRKHIKELQQARRTYGPARLSKA
ncbi:MAG TPA: HEXXH motif-containing putative peptide modification protein [Nitrospira sp.]|nr:HEXXH motif-containing putative peptide modification protein [Nitrospira sp.]